MFDALENRRLLTAVLTDNGQLRIEGSEAHDQILVTRDGNKIHVSISEREDILDGVLDEEELEKNFNVNDVESIRIRGLSGSDLIDVGRRIIAATILGGEGNDDISGGENGDVVEGGEDDDIISGAQGNDTLRGNAGFDKISGGDGNDVISGGADDDDLAGGENRDQINGNAGDDTLTGGDGADQLNGSSDNDRFYAFDGNRDTIVAGSGDDAAKLDQAADRYDEDLELIVEEIDILTAFVVVKVNDDENEVQSAIFGGNSVLSAIAEWDSEGLFTVTFEGIFPRLITNAVVGALVSSNNAGDFTFAAADVDTSEPDQIVVKVRTWEGDSSLADHDFTLQLLINPFIALG